MTQFHNFYKNFQYAGDTEGDYGLADISDED